MKSEASKREKKANIPREALEILRQALIKDRPPAWTWKTLNLKEKLGAIASQFMPWKKIYERA